MQSGKPSQPAKSILRSYYVTDRSRLRSGDLISAIGQAIVAGVDMIQIREKDLPRRVLEELAGGGVGLARAGGRTGILVDNRVWEELAVRAVELARQSGRTEILVNDRLDVALATGAAGVHLPATGLPVEAVKRVVYNRGARLLIGVSTHTLEEAQRAAGAGADYLIFGPVFETASKPGQPATGLDTLARGTRSGHVPVFAP